MKITLTIDASPQDIKMIRDDAQGFIQEIENVLRSRRIQQPIIDLRSAGFPSLRWEPD